VSGRGQRGGHGPAAALGLLTVGAAGATGALLAAALRRRRSLRRLDFSAARAAALRFPAGFRWGAATSAHQAEGGTTNNNWTAWEQTTRQDGRPGIFTGESCGAAADHWNRFAADVGLMADLGLDTYRFSVEWSRVEPAEGRFDGAALARYRSWCEQLRAAGIEPLVTLHHFTEPLWITERGGWEDPRTVDSFVRFAEHVADALGDVVAWWVTVNEPTVYAVMGWWFGEFPPGKTDAAAMARVLEHLLLAHARAGAAVRQRSPGSRVSIAKNLVLFSARRWWNPAEILAADTLDRLFNRSVLDACLDGRLRIRLPGVGSFEAHHPELAGSLDYLGVNHYFRQLVSVDPRAAGFVRLGFDDACEKNDMGWDLTPQSLYDALMLARAYPWPILVTEHGTCDEEQPDRRRQWFLLQSLYALAEAIGDGVDVRGYIHWALLDNFEWAHGFEPRFGLYRVDYPTQERTLTGGGELYRRIIAGPGKQTPR
jgi:beta-glucosidase